ncbi:MAG: hypothetical protein AAF514_21565, partial [Verrucomicrobiota bacterium]
NIFYTGINLGAAISPLLCGYVGETYGWHYGFGLATIGMLVGLAVFVMPNRLTSVLILTGAIATAIGMLLFRPDNPLAIAVNLFVALCLIISAVISSRAVNRGGLPAWAGGRPEGMDARNDWKIYLGIALAIPTFALLVSGFSPFTQPPVDEATGLPVPVPTNEERMATKMNQLEKFEVEPGIITAVREKGIDGEFKQHGKPFQLIPDDVIERVQGDSFIGNMAGIFLEEISKPAGLVLTILGLLAFGYLLKETFRLDRIPRQRMMAALVLIFFQMLFFAFFEQAGSSVNNFTDRNIDRVGESETVSTDMVGQTVRLEPTQAQLGYERNGEVFTLSDLDALRKVVYETPGVDNIDIAWTFTENNVGMGIAKRLDELPASIFQSFNSVFILIFALALNWLWRTLSKRSLDPPAPVKFGLGLIQLGLGFGAFWLGAQNCNSLGMVTITWLTLGILLQTTGELFLSPVGLSAMTKLSPKALVSTLMGAWFLATAFSQYLAGIISQFTSVDSSQSSGDFPTPNETVNIYGDVFGNIALAAIVCGGLCMLLSPILNRWMHADAAESVNR